tara:strand:- start:1436 stop:1561 length:126 start_codon:yes stop_codon:yes gene_type:complete
MILKFSLLIGTLVIKSTQIQSNLLIKKEAFSIAWEAFLLKS